jgi:aminocarboxymuconate-semialdehyde decarboxylase
MVANGLRGPMLKIDIHTHIMPPTLPNFTDQFGYNGFMKLVPCSDGRHVDMVNDNGKFFRSVGANTFDADLRLEECDAAKVNVQVISTVPVLFSYWAKPKDCLEVSKFLNDHISEVVKKNPKRFVGLGTVPLNDPDLAVQETVRCAQELGIRGIQIGSHVNQLNLSDKSLFPFYEACEKLGMSLFVHPWEMMGQERMPEYFLPWLVGMPAETSLAICSMIFGGVFEKFPKLRVAFAHGGGNFPFGLGRIQKGFDSRPDLCAVDCKKPPRDFIGQFFVDSLVHDTDALKYLVKLMGARRVCLGSDYPFPLGEDYPGALIESCKFDEKTKANLFYESALEWLAMKKTDFI